MLKEIWRQTFTNTFQAIDPEGPEAKFDKKVLWVMVVSALSLMGINYLGSVNEAAGLLKSLGLASASSSLMTTYRSSSDPQLFALAYWASCSFFFYAVFPGTFLLVVFKDRLKEYGTNMKGMIEGYKIYILFFLFMVPLIWWVSHNVSFQSKYPFYDMNSADPNWRSLLIWECFYLLQFIGLEFFFRGFIVHGLKHKLGFYAIFVMMLPYCMIHFGKPWQETTGAIVAGMVLGSLSLKSNSIWLGVAIHFSVAITMDTFALYQKGVLG